MGQSIKLDKPEDLHTIGKARLLRTLAGPGQSAMAIVALTAALLVWLWPIGLGRRMPVGGDVTQFFPRSYGRPFPGHRWRRGGCPLWNDLWGLWISRHGREPDGGVYPPHLLPLGLLAARASLRGKPCAAHTLGRRWGVLGGAAVWRLTRRRGVAGFASSTTRLLRDSHAPSLGLHHGLLDALGLGAGMVGPFIEKADTGRPAVSAGPGTCPSGLARTLSARLLDADGNCASSRLVPGQPGRGNGNDRRTSLRALVEREARASAPLGLCLAMVFPLAAL